MSEPALRIIKPSGFSLDQYKSTVVAAAAGVETLLGALPVHRLSDAKDFVRLHPDEPTHWTEELCFVSVPIKGAKRDTLHLIAEHLANKHLPGGRVERFRLALAAKPNNVFFLCRVPTQNLDNIWNEDNLKACTKAKAYWTQAISRTQTGAEGYEVKVSPDVDFFPPPIWPTQSLEELIEVSFANRQIDTDNHPGLLRLIGIKQRLG